MRTRFSLAMLSSARVLSSVILAGKRDFRLHSTSSFSELCRSGETVIIWFESLSFCDQWRA